MQLEKIRQRKRHSKYAITREIYNYPFSARENENVDYLSDKIDRFVVKTTKKVKRGLKWAMPPAQAIAKILQEAPLDVQIGVGPQAQFPSTRLRTEMSKEKILRRAVQTSGVRVGVDFTKSEIDKLLEIALEYRDCASAHSNPELLRKLKNIRGGFLPPEDVLKALSVVVVIMLIANGTIAFNLNLPVPPGGPPKYMEFLYGEHMKPPSPYGYGSSYGDTQTARSATQNAGSGKDYPSSGSYDYKSIMEQMRNQEHKKTVRVEVGLDHYTVRNIYGCSAEELQFLLADQLYDEIRSRGSDDVEAIAAKLGYKPKNVQKVKDHVFYNQHLLDLYGPEYAEKGRFDADLQQGLAWKRLEMGIGSDADKTWFKHEYAEQRHETKFDSGYKEAHERAQRHFDGAPWQDDEL